MKILKSIIFLLLGIIVLALIVAAFLPKTFKGKGTVTINKPKQEVFNYVKYVRNQENYGIWFKMDPNIQKKSIGTDGTVGYQYNWTSKKVGNGKQVITKIDDGNEIDMDLFFQDTKEPAQSYIRTTSASPTSTQVDWVVEGKMPYPLNIMCLFFDMSKDLQQGAENLKSLLEKQ